MTTTDETAKGMVLRLADADGNQYRWRLYRITNVSNLLGGGIIRKIPSLWMLCDHDGYERSLEETYLLSVPKVRVIADNYGFQFLHDFS